MKENLKRNRFNPRHWSLALRINLAITLLVILALASMTLIVSRAVRDSLTAQLGESFESAAQSLSEQTSSFFIEKVSQIQVLTLSDLIKDELEQRNESYPADEAAALAQIMALEAEWQGSTGVDPLVRNIMLADPIVNPVAFQVNDLAEVFEDHRVVLITDRYGALVAATRRVDHYYQGDEAWWQAAWNDGEGAVYISKDIVVDKVSGKEGFVVAIPIYAEETGDPLGVAYSLIDADGLFGFYGEIRRGETGHAMLFGSDDTSLFEGIETIADDAIVEELPAETKQTFRMHSMMHEAHVHVGPDEHGTQSLFGHRAITVEAEDEAHPIEAELAAAVTNLNWIAVVQQPEEEAFSAINQIQQLTIMAGLVAVVVSLGAGSLLSFNLTRPVARLRATAEAVAAGNLDVSLPPAGGDEIGVLTASFGTMIDRLRTTLEALETHNRGLNLAAEVGQHISRVQDVEDVLHEAVEMIRERFDLYHVQIYLTDAAEQILMLKAGSGTVGDLLVQRGHRLLVGPGSINGTAVSKRETVIVADTAVSDAFTPNPLLPATRSEMALPLIAGNRVVGVLDLQSSHPQAFTSVNQPVFETLAGQLAITVENTGLFKEITQAQAEVEAQARRLAHSGWSEFLDGINKGRQVGYAYNLGEVEALTDDALPQTPDADDADAMMQPITVVGEPIGVIQIEDMPDRAWTPEEAELVEIVAQQVAQQVENLRLLAETERFRHESERAISRLTREGWQKYVDDVQKEGFVYDKQMVKLLEAADPAADESQSDGSSLNLPLVVRGTTIGQLELVDPAAMDKEAAEMVSAVVEQLSAHIENLRLAEQTEMALSQTENLYQVGHELNAAANVDAILHAALGPIFPTGIDEATLMFIELDKEGEPHTLELLASWRMDGNPSFPVGTIFPIERFPFTRLFINSPDEPQLIGDVTTDERVDEFTRGIMAQAKIKAIAVIPLTLGGHWVGIITCSWPEPHPFNNQEKEIFSALINMAAPAVQSQRLFYKTKTQAEKEHLINMINQRIQNTVSVERALQTAVKELGQALHATARVKLGTAPLTNGRQAVAEK